MQFHLSPEAAAAYPDACFGFLAVQGAADPIDPALEAQRIALEQDLRAQFTAADQVRSDPVVQAYGAYYKRFKKSYHVSAQLESVALKGRAIPAVTPLVTAMFMAELQDRMLTAGHDLATLSGDLTVQVAQGGESYPLLGGAEQALKAGDLYMHDERGILSSILYGPDARTPIQPATGAALYAVYAPPGVGAQRMADHLERILHYVRLAYPGAQVRLQEILA